MSRDSTIFDKEYEVGEYIYGRDPSPICDVIQEKKLLKAGMNILDIGGGYGRDAVHLAKYNISTTVVDISGIAIEQGKNFAQGVSVDFKQEDLIEYNFKAQYYDLICSYQVLHLFDMKSDLKAVFKNISQALKRGGWMIHMFLSDKCTPLESAEHHYEIYKHKKEDLDNLCKENNLNVGDKIDYKYVLEYHHYKYHPHIMWLLMCNKT